MLRGEILYGTYLRLVIGRHSPSNAVVPRHAENDKSLRSELLLPFQDRRECVDTGTAPRSPKVQQYDFSSQVGKRLFPFCKELVYLSKLRSSLSEQFILRRALL